MRLFSFPTQVDERAARLVAATVASLLGVALFFRLTWIVPMLAMGFLLRVGWGPRVSPLAKVAVWTAGRLGPPKRVAGSPKRFAQGIGAACLIAASTLLAMGAVTVGWSVVAVVIVFALLEASLAFCMGCQLYALLQRTGLLPADACVDCGPRVTSNPL